MQYIHHFRLHYTFSVQHRVGSQKSEHIQRNMNSAICSQIKLEPDLQLDRKPFKRKWKFPHDVSNLGTNMVFQKKKY